MHSEPYTDRKYVSSIAFQSAVVGSYLHNDYCSDFLGPGWVLLLY